MPLHPQNCPNCDNPAWLIRGFLYDVIGIYFEGFDNKKATFELEFHECEKDEEQEDANSEV